MKRIGGMIMHALRIGSDDRRWLMWAVAAMFLGALVARPAASVAADEAKKPHVVFVTGDDEYRSEISMPMIAKILEARHNLRTSVAYAKPTPQTKNNIVGLEALKDADLAVIFVRFRALPDDQLKMILDYTNSGKPLVGLRTATHAFLYPEGDKHVALNDSFGREVWGQKWLFHNGHSSSTNVSVIRQQEQHPILRGLPEGFHCRSWLYHVLPLEGDCTPLLMGTAVKSEIKDNKSVPNPVAWTKIHKGARVFFTTLGHPQDFEFPAVRQLLINGILWTLDREIPAEGAASNPVGEYIAPPTT
jgi:type 1 glutamine amidotransferase